MTPSNLAICFGPIFMGQKGPSPDGDIKDAGWQAKVVETILNNAFQIFDDDELEKQVTSDRVRMRALEQQDLNTSRTTEGLPVVYRKQGQGMRLRS